MRVEMDAREALPQGGLPSIDLSCNQPDRCCVTLLKEVFARNYQSIPVRQLQGGVLVAMAAPVTDEAISAVSFHMGRKIYPAQAEPAAVKAAIEACYSQSAFAPASRQPEYKAEPRHNRTIAVISNKGGVGKTHTSLNLAASMAAAGGKMLLIDADLGNADISNKLALFPERNLLGYLNDEVRLEDAVSSTPYGFDLVAGASGDYRLANLNYVQRTKFIRNFRKIGAAYDHTIFDLSAGISSAVIDFALAADEVVVVTTPQDLIAGYACIKAAYQRFVLIERRLMEKAIDYTPQRAFTPWIIMNQVSDLKQGQLLFERITKTVRDRINSVETDFALTPRYLGGLLYDKEAFRRAEEAHEPLVSLAPSGRPAQSFTHLGLNLLRAPDERRVQEGFEGGFKRFAAVLGLA